MKKLFLATVWTSIIGLAPMAVLAQEDDANTCGLVEHPELLKDVMTMMLGPWRVTHQSGYVVMPNMVIPFPGDDEIDTVTLARDGDDLIATHPQMQAPMVFRMNDEPPWSFMADDSGRGIPAPTITSEDLSIVYDCPVEKMPRLIGTTTMVVEGGVMNTTWRMMILDTNNMVAVQHMEGTMQGYSFYSRRTVLLNR